MYIIMYAGFAPPEVRKGKAVPASLSIDVFPAGILLVLILRKACSPHFTILPLNTDDTPSSPIRTNLTRLLIVVN